MNAGVAPLPASPESPRVDASASTPHPAAIPLLHRLWEMKLLLSEQKIAVLMHAYRQGKEKPVVQVASIDAEIDRLSIEIQAEKEHMYHVRRARQMATLPGQADNASGSVWGMHVDCFFSSILRLTFSVSPQICSPLDLSSVRIANPWYFLAMDRLAPELVAFNFPNLQSASGAQPVALGKCPSIAAVEAKQ